jgi:hypothetical protein
VVEGHGFSRAAQYHKNAGFSHPNLILGKGPGRVREVVEGRGFSRAAEAPMKCGL